MLNKRFGVFINARMELLHLQVITDFLSDNIVVNSLLTCAKCLGPFGQFNQTVN